MKKEPINQKQAPIIINVYTPTREFHIQDANLTELTGVTDKSPGIAGGIKTSLSN